MTVVALTPHRRWLAGEEQEFGPYDIDDRATQLKLTGSLESWPFLKMLRENVLEVSLEISYGRNIWRPLIGAGMNGAPIIDNRKEFYTGGFLPMKSGRKARFRVRTFAPIVTSLALWNAIAIIGTPNSNFAFATTITVPALDAGSGDDRCLVGSIVMAQSLGTLTSFVYNTVPLITIRDYNPASRPHIILSRLLAPSTGSNVLEAVINTAADTVVAGFAMSGVDQSTPAEVESVADGTASPVTVDVANSGSGHLVIDAMGVNHSAGGSTTTVGAGQTARIDRENYDGAHSAGMSTEDGGAGTITMSWTATNVSSWTTIAASFRPATGVVDELIGSRRVMIIPYQI